MPASAASPNGEPLSYELGSYELDPVAAYQQLVDCRDAVLFAPTPTQFIVIANLGQDTYEVAGNGPSDPHFILKMVSKTFSSTGRASGVIQYLGTEDVELKNGFKSRVAMYLESESQDVRSAWADIRALEGRATKANQVFIASLYATHFRSDAQRSKNPRDTLAIKADVKDLAELVGAKDAGESMDYFIRNHSREYWILVGALRGYYKPAVTLQQYTESTKDPELIRAAELFRK